MSGIAAILERSGAPAGRTRIGAMLGRLRRRGPDGSAFHVDGPVALAQARFETTPEDAFDRQPLGSRSGKRWIVADARVDNRRELLDLLGEPGDVAGEIPDAALILRAYERWGEACPSRLVGDFAFVVWDAGARRLLCVRDHLGTRQLYYQDDGTAFRCATEMDVLFADDRVPRRPDRRAMALFLGDRYAERDRTLYEGLHALPPGHLLVVTATSIRRSAYWQPDPSRTLSCGLDESAARFAEVFAEAVRCRLRAQRPVAAHVSGGLDSSSVACEAVRLQRLGSASGPPLTLLRSVFPGLSCDEQPYSDAVAAHLGLPIVTCNPLVTPNICRPELAYPDLYFHPTSTMLDPLLPGLRRAGVRVVLTGLAGDVLMQPGGFDGAYHLRRGHLGGALDDATEGSLQPSLAAFRRLAVQGAWLLAPGATDHLRKSRRHAADRWPWLSREAAGMVDADVAENMAEIRRLHPDLLQGKLCRGVTHGVGTLLPMALVDRSDALQGIEERHPFFDVRVVELLLALPPEQRFTWRESKRVLRRALGSTLPPLVRERRDKSEFTSYARRVFLADQRSAIQRLLTRSHLEEHGLIGARPLRQLLDLPPEEQHPMGVVNLVAVELWLRAALQSTVRPTSLVHEERYEQA